MTGTPRSRPNRSLWYAQPASTWLEALPLGNGRLGAMVFGETASERISLNEESLWAGAPRSRVNPDALRHLSPVQRLLAEGRIAEAERLAMMTLTGVPEEPAHYVPVGDLTLEWDGLGPVSGYRRELDLTEAVARTEFLSPAGRWTQEVLVSAADQVVTVRITAEGGLNGRIRLVRPEDPGTIDQLGGDTVGLRGDGQGVGFAALVRGRATGGSLSVLGPWLVVEDVRELVILVAVATTFRYGDPGAEARRVLDAVPPWNDLKRRHIEDYRSLFDRMDLDLGAPEPETLPTDRRLALVQAGASDPGLIELSFRYGRYLLLSSSRPGTLPANLQGLWNDSFRPPWGSKFTININTQMNYWLAEPGALGECHLPLLGLLERMLPSGREVARRMYGCRGFVAHHNTDLWGDCAPVDLWVPGTLWPLGAAWLCLHLWQHWEYSGDEEFLRRAFPIIEDAVLFFLDFLTEDAQGRLVTSPSVSPENSYRLPTGAQGSLCSGPSMDSQILAALFDTYAAASEVLGVSSVILEQTRAARLRLPQPQIGKGGRLLEWAEEYDEVEPGHRHISHLFALHPGEQITRKNPELLEACRATLEYRLANGGGHTGWSQAWIVNLWARLGDGDRAWEALETWLRHSVAANLFDLHPPSLFQIDGNLGTAAGLLELFVRSLGDEIELLPALPQTLPQGSVRGVRAKGGFEISLEWTSGRLVRGLVLAHRPGTCRLRYFAPVQIRRGDSLVETHREGEILSFKAESQAEYQIWPGEGTVTPPGF